MTRRADLRTAALLRIENAFRVGPPPSLQEMRNDHCPECRETAQLFAGRLWTDVRPADLSGSTGPSLLTDAGFRYFLPAMMSCAIQAPEELDCFPASVIGMLSPKRGGLSDRESRLLAGFTKEQVQAILAFLRFFARVRLEEEFGDDAADESVEVPVDKVLTRAIEYWAARSGGAGVTTGAGAVGAETP